MLMQQVGYLILQWVTVIFGYMLFIGKQLLLLRLIIMEVQKEQMMGEMQSEVARLAMTAAAKVLGQENSSLNDKKLYDQFLSKAGESYDTENV